MELHPRFAFHFRQEDGDLLRHIGDVQSRRSSGLRRRSGRYRGRRCTERPGAVETRAGIGLAPARSFGSAKSQRRLPAAQGKSSLRRPTHRDLEIHRFSATVDADDGRTRPQAQADDDARSISSSSPSRRGRSLPTRRELTAMPASRRSCASRACAISAAGFRPSAMGHKR
jgi:hypothetical protein